MTQFNDDLTAKEGKRCHTIYYSKGEKLLIQAGRFIQRPMSLLARERLPLSRQGLQIQKRCESLMSAARLSVLGLSTFTLILSSMPMIWDRRLISVARPAASLLWWTRGVPARRPSQVCDSLSPIIA